MRYLSKDRHTCIMTAPVCSIFSLTTDTYLSRYLLCLIICSVLWCFWLHQIYIFLLCFSHIHGRPYLGCAPLNWPRSKIKMYAYLFKFNVQIQFNPCTVSSNQGVDVLDVLFIANNYLQYISFCNRERKNGTWMCSYFHNESSYYIIPWMWSCLPDKYNRKGLLFRIVKLCILNVRSQNYGTTITYP